MISNKDIFNVNKVVMPFSGKDIDSIISKSVISGYVATTYDTLITTLKDIAKATQYPVTLNPNAIFMGSNNPLTRNNVIIQVEGTQLYTEFINNVVKTGESESWSNFITYSELMKDEIKNIKTQAYKKFLWNYHNIDAWFTNKNIGLITNDKNILLTDFESFRDRHVAVCSSGTSGSPASGSCSIEGSSQINQSPKNTGVISSSERASDIAARILLNDTQCSR